MSKWMWMMDWCKRNGLSPANHRVWKLAEKAYEYRYKGNETI